MIFALIIMFLIFRSITYPFSGMYFYPRRAYRRGFWIGPRPMMWPMFGLRRGFGHGHHHHHGGYGAGRRF